MFGFLINASLSALNVAFYASSGHHWYNLAVAVFCGLVAFFCLALDLS